MTNTRTAKTTDYDLQPAYVDHHVIMCADNDGQVGYGPVPQKVIDASIARLVAGGLAVTAPEVRYNKATGMRSGGTWLTEAGWLMRRAYRAAENMSTDEVVGHLLMTYVRPVGACKITYPATMTRRHGAAES